MRPFDRNDFAPWLGALRAAMRRIGEEAQRRHGAKASGRVAGLLFNCRLSFGIIVATVGLNVGILTECLYAVVLLVVIASAALPAILRRDRPAEWE